MRKGIVLLFVELALLAGGIGMDRWLPDMPAYGWFAVALLMAAAAVGAYWPEVGARQAASALGDDIASPPQDTPFGTTKAIWQVAPGAGRNAAKAIATAPTLEDVRGIWGAFLSAPRRTDTNWACWAFLSRLEEAGHGDEINDLIGALVESGEDIDPTEEIEATIKGWRDDR